MKANYYGIAPVQQRLRDAARERGAVRATAALAGFAAAHAAGLPLGAHLARRTFTHDGRTHRYAATPRTPTWLTERTVELPVIGGLVREHAGARVLEVGHVLGHHLPVAHEVVDKFERAPGVRNVDVLDLPATERYDLIVSVSTLEHVGWDDAPRDPARAIAAVHHLRSLLAPGGLLAATVPVGYNPVLVEAVVDGRAGFDRVTALARAGRLPRWEERPPAAVAGLPYDRLLYRAPAVLFASARG